MILENKTQIVSPPHPPICSSKQNLHYGQVHTTFSKTTPKAQDYCIYIAYISDRQTGQLGCEHPAALALVTGRS